MKQQTVIPYADVLRSQAIYLVIALHCAAMFLSNAGLFGSKTWWFCNVMNSFARMGVPIFFMLSGFLLLSAGHTRNVKSFYKKRLTKLVLPFLVWDVIYFVETCVINGEPPRITVFFSQLLYIGSKYHLWFLYQIAAIYLILPFIKKIVDHSTKRELVLLFAVILLPTTGFRLLNVVQTMYTIAPFRALLEGYLGFFILGYLLGTCVIPPWGRKLIYLGGLAGLAICTVGNYLFSSPQGINLIWNEGYCIVHYMTSAALFLLVKEHTDQLPHWAIRAAHKLSKLTFGVYLLHPLILDLFFVLTQRYAVGLSAAWYTVSSFILASLVSTLTVFLVSKNKALKRIFF